MSYPSPQAKTLRHLIGAFPGTWVRVFRDGSICCGRRDPATGCPTDRQLDAIQARLEANGYQVKRGGKPGTSGEHTLDIWPPPEADESP